MSDFEEGDYVRMKGGSEVHLVRAAFHDFGHKYFERIMLESLDGSEVQEAPAAQFEKVPDDDPVVLRDKFERSGKLDDFQAVASLTAVYPDRGECLLYPVLGLVDEACEVAESVRRVMNSQFFTMEHEALFTLLEVLDHAGRLAALFKKLHRDGNGTTPESFRVMVRGLADGIEDAAKRLSAAADAEPRVVLPPVPMSDSQREVVIKECSDVQWYISQVAAELNTPLREVASTNVAKLMSRRERGTLHGSGDDR